MEYFKQELRPEVSESRVVHRPISGPLRCQKHGAVAAPILLSARSNVYSFTVVFYFVSLFFSTQASSCTRTPEDSYHCQRLGGYTTSREAVPTDIGAKLMIMMIVILKLFAAFGISGTSLLANKAASWLVHPRLARSWRTASLHGEV